MSFDLPAGAVLAPHHQGMEEGEDPNNLRQYFFFAYRHPHGPSWFGGSRRLPGSPVGDNGMTHYILSGVRGREIPPKPDEAVAAINRDEYSELVRLGVLWWNDYAAKLFELGQPYVAQHFPGRDVRDAPLPVNIKWAAAKWAHRLVARRAGEEHELPDDHDTLYYAVADHGIPWELM